MYVKLEAEGHTVHVESEDPYYTTFFSSLKEACGEVPDVLSFSGAVLQQWKYWVDLRQWMDCAGTRIFLTQGATVLKVYEMHEEFSNLYAPYADARDMRQRWRAPAVALHDVQPVLRSLVDGLRDDWVLFVYVDERTPEEERVRHYKAVGRVIRSTAIVNSCWTEYRVCLGLHVDPARSYSHLPAKSAGLLEESLEIAWGMAHGAELRSLTGKFDWSFINWHDALTYIKHSCVSVKLCPCDEDEGDRMVMRCLAGVEVLQFPDTSYNTNICSTFVPLKGEVVNTEAIPNWPLLHERLMSAYANVDDATALGLGLLVQDSVNAHLLRPAVPIHAMLSVVHFRVIVNVLGCGPSRVFTDIAQIRQAVRDLEHAVGRRGLDFIVSKLSKYTNKLAVLFCEEAAK